VAAEEKPLHSARTTITRHGRGPRNATPN
jgi:hypothetical protein